MDAPWVKLGFDVVFSETAAIRMRNALHQVPEAMQLIQR